MKIYLKEKIGNPGLFTGRKQELNYFLDWIDGIKREISKSSALISRRKTGRKGNYSLIMEVKNRETKFSIGEATRFLEIARELIRLEQVEKAVLLVFSRSGFHTDALKYLKENHIARSSDPRWLDDGMLSDRGIKINC